MIYVFKHPKREKYVEVVMGMREKHEYFDKRGLQWMRVFAAPQLTISAKIDPFSQKQFVEKTANKGSVGDLLDRSRELSERRKDKCGGVDPVQEKFFHKYSKKRKGYKHEADPKRYEKLKKLGAQFV
jgi:hypothetical protein